MRSSWFHNRPKLGDWNVICDLTGRKLKASQVVERWDGLIVDRREVEDRHPQDFLRGVKDDQRVPFTRPEQPDVFLERNRTGDEL